MASLTTTGAAASGAAALRPPRRRRARGRGGWLAVPFLLPNVVLCAVFLVYPLVMAFVVSARHQESLGQPYWIGLANYVGLLGDPVFWRALLNTVVFTVATVPVGMALGLGAALLLDAALPGRAVYRSIIFLPLVISGVATGVLGSWLFDQYDGLVNDALRAVGISGPAWQSSGPWAMVSVIVMTIWVRLGFDMLIYLAGLQGIDGQLLEAARMDGAGWWQRLRRIVFPLLGPSTFFLLVMNLLYSFQVFDTVYAMTAGGPGDSTTMLVTYAYRVGFDEKGPGQLGYAACVGVVIYAITLAITAAHWWASRTRDQVS